MFRFLRAASTRFVCLSIASLLLCPGAAGNAWGAADEVIVRGVLAGESTEVRCEVPSEFAPLQIVEAIPDGEQVQAGDLLARLDTTLLEAKRTEAQIVALENKAGLVQAESELSVSKAALAEFLEGTYVAEKESAAAAVQLAEAALALASRSLECARTGSAPEFEVAKLELAVQQAQHELRFAKLKLDVLEKFTRPKIVKQLESAVAVASARCEVAKARLALCMERVKKVEAAIEKCAIKAPAAGRLVHEAEGVGPGYRAEPGEVLLRLYDHRDLQFHGRISKTAAERVRARLPATVVIDAFPDRSLKGRVREVQSVREKDPMVIIELSEPPESLRPGLTGDARIAVDPD